MADYDISSLVAAAIAQKPADFRDALNGLIIDRAAAAVERYKDNIAQQLVAPEDAEGEAEDAEYEGEYDTEEPEVEDDVVDDEETE